MPGCGGALGLAEPRRPLPSRPLQSASPASSGPGAGRRVPVLRARPVTLSAASVGSSVLPATGGRTVAKVSGWSLEPQPGWGAGRPVHLGAGHQRCCELAWGTYRLYTHPVPPSCGSACPCAPVCPGGQPREGLMPVQNPSLSPSTEHAECALCRSWGSGPPPWSPSQPAGQLLLGGTLGPSLGQRCRHGRGW